MAKDKNSGPVPTLDSPGTKAPAPAPVGGNAFQDMVRNALGQIETTNAMGEVVPPGAEVPPAGVSHPQVALTPVPHQPVVPRSVGNEDHSMAAYQAMLRREEELLAQRRAATPQIDPYEMVARHTTPRGVPQGAVLVLGEPKYKDGADPLLVECHKTLLRAVAGGMLHAYGTFFTEVSDLTNRVGAAVVATEQVPETKGAV